MNRPKKELLNTFPLQHKDLLQLSRNAVANFLCCDAHRLLTVVSILLHHHLGTSNESFSSKMMLRSSHRYMYLVTCDHGHLHLNLYSCRR